MCWSILGLIAVLRSIGQLDNRSFGNLSLFFSLSYYVFYFLFFIYFIFRYVRLCFFLFLWYGCCSSSFSLSISSVMVTVLYLVSSSLSVLWWSLCFARFRPFCQLCDSNCGLPLSLCQLCDSHCVLLGLQVPGPCPHVQPPPAACRPGIKWSDFMLNIKTLVWKKEKKSHRCESLHFSST